MNRGFLAYLMVTLKGIGMGAADVIPGVSGGTIAFITEIYEELVDSIKSINYTSIRKVWKEGLGAFWKAVNGNFLLSLVIGILISVLSLARILEYILIHHPILIWSFFFGLIIASAVFVAKKIDRWNVSVIISLVAGVIAAYFITSFTPAETTNAYWFIFLSGALAICAMILPGISGSFILLLLGKYQFMLNALNEGKIGIIAVLLAGALIGIISFANLLSWLLKRYHNITIALLAGFMLGSLNKIWPWKITISTFTDSHGELKPLIQQNVLPGRFAEAMQTDPQIFSAVLLALAGMAIILLFEGISRLRKS
jgi:putative membrane protein